MKQYQLTQAYLQYPEATIFVGPLPILAQSALGFYPKGTEDTAPSDQCLFASAVEGNTELFKLVTE